MRQYDNIIIEQGNSKKGITLIELLIAMVLMSLIVLSLGSIDLYSHYHVLNSGRRAQVQNEVTYVLEHMTKNISRAIGTNLPNENPVGNVNSQMIVYVTDSNSNLRRDMVLAFIPSDPAYDTIELYRRDPANASKKYDLWYCSVRTLFDLQKCGNGAMGETLSRKITNMNPSYNSNNNYIDVELTGCYEPGSTTWSCGTPDNPTVTMHTRIKMPLVSTN